MSGRSRLIVANLDAELSYARHDGGMRSRQLPARIATAASAMGTLLRIFAREDDQLYTPLPVDRNRLPPALDLPRPRLISGDTGALQPAAVLAWAETDQTSALRARAGDPTPWSPDATRGWEHLLWQTLAARSETAARLNHRGFLMQLRSHLGHELPGASLIGSVEQLADHLAAGAAEPTGGRWVVKAPYCAAGRDRVIAAGASIGAPAQRSVARLLGHFGGLLFEPWVERIADFGCCAVVDGRGVTIVGDHRLEVDARGGVRAIVVDTQPGRDRADGERMRDVTTATGEVLREHGYRGPFGLDGWRYLDGSGQQRLQPLGELNARLTFGFVAHALVRRARARYGDDIARYRLRLGAGADRGQRPDALVHTLSLLQPIGEDPTHAELELIGKG